MCFKSPREKYVVIYWFIETFPFLKGLKHQSFWLVGEPRYSPLISNEVDISSEQCYNCK